MKRLILIAVLVHACSIGAFAQKVYKDGTNRVILDLSAEAGMPAGAMDATPKAWGGTPSNTVAIDNNLQSEPINAQVYPKLEIAPYDMNSDGVIDDNTTGTFTMNWATAFDGCMKSTSLGGGWRLPTQREFMYMWIFKVAFDNLLPTSFVSTEYWSATESNATNSWYVLFTDGTTNTSAKGYAYRVRCVRELPMP